jgi:hypothetical protein
MLLRDIQPKVQDHGSADDKAIVEQLRQNIVSALQRISDKDCDSVDEDMATIRRKGTKHSNST